MDSLGFRGSIATVLLVGSVVALTARTAAAEPGVLYVPTEDVELNPFFDNGCGGQVNSALGCVGPVDASEVVAPYPQAMMLRAVLADALLPYDVHLATERPPEYLAYTMLLPSTMAEPESNSFTCSAGGINCSARKRNGIIWVFGPTQSCPTLDVELASIYEFGRNSGLEGVQSPLDAMHYVPDYTMGTGAFVDACSPIVNQISINGEGVPVDLPLECTSLDHQGCAVGQQNGHADLLAYYGPRVVDLDPPVLTNLEPGDGAVIPDGGSLALDVDILDADPVVGGRWTVVSPVFEDLGFEDGVLTFCTNACEYGWDDASPLKATDSDWSLALDGLPSSTYEVTFEAADFHGNVAEPVSMVVYVGEGPPGSDSGEGGWDSGWDEGEGGWDEGPTFTTGDSGPPDGSGGADGPPPPDDDTGTGGAEADDGLIPHGCICTASRAREGGDAGWWLMVAAAALGRRRRRRSA